MPSKDKSYRAKVLSKLGLWATVVAGLMALPALVISWVTWDTTRTASQVQAWQYIAQEETEINRAFVEYPEIRPYFFGGISVSKTDANYSRVMAIADMKLVFFDSFDDPAIKSLPGMEPGGRYQVRWAELFANRFASSPALCNRYVETKATLTAALGPLADKNCARPLPNSIRDYSEPKLRIGAPSKKERLVPNQTAPTI